MANISKSIKNLVNGQDRANTHLVNAIKQFGLISDDEAQKVATFYKKNRLVKLDAIHGTAHVKHGAYYNRDVILRALEMAA